MKRWKSLDYFADWTELFHSIDRYFRKTSQQQQLPAFLNISVDFREYPFQGGISFNTAGSISTSWMWKLSPGKLPLPRTWNNTEMDIFKKVSRFLWEMSGMWKLSLDVEIAPGCGN